MDLCFPRLFPVKFLRQVSCQVSSSRFHIKSLAKFLVKLNVWCEILLSSLTWNFVTKADVKFCRQVWREILSSGLMWNFVVKFLVKFIVQLIVKSDVKFCCQVWRPVNCQVSCQVSSSSFLVKFPRQVSLSSFLVKFPCQESSSSFLI